MFKLKEKIDKTDKNSLPVHIGIIMDGNGRYAKKKGLERTLGHSAGVEQVREILRTCSDIGIKYLTLYAFSTENWKRPDTEVSFLMNLLLKYMRNEIDELNRENVKINAIGDLTKLPKEVHDEVLNAVFKTKSNTGLNVIFALNYGAREEIALAVRDIAGKCLSGEINVETIDESTVSKHLYTKDIPDPDLIIRTSGELRISNFLLFQIAYSEFYFTEKTFPEFGEAELHTALEDFAQRKRRYGGL